jgi:DNA-binding Lrp family transcriptional regulator
MLTIRDLDKAEAVTMTTPRSIDGIDAGLLRTLTLSPRAATVSLAEQIGVSRNTVHARLNRWDDLGALRGFDRRIDPGFLGYPLRAYVFTQVEQRLLHAVSASLARVPEVIAVDGLSGGDDLLVQVVARDADDLYRVAGQILDIRGVERTRTALVMRELVDFRLAQLLPRSTSAS